jgi:hypothetical protein
VLLLPLLLMLFHWHHIRHKYNSDTSKPGNEEVEQHNWSSSCQLIISTSLASPPT